MNDLITDPDLIARLNAKKQAATPAVASPVAAAAIAPKSGDLISDPALVAHLNAKKQGAAPANPDGYQPSIPYKNAGPNDYLSQVKPTDMVSEFGTDMARGLKQGAGNVGVRAIDLVYRGMRDAGIVDPSPVLEEAFKAAHQDLGKQAEGTGVGGAAGEFIGNPIVSKVFGAGNQLARRVAANAGTQATARAVAKGSPVILAQRAGTKAAAKVLLGGEMATGAAGGAAAGILDPEKQASMGDRAKLAGEDALYGAGGAVLIPGAIKGAKNAVTGARGIVRDLTTAVPDQIEREALLGQMKSKGGATADAMRSANISVNPSAASAMLSDIDSRLRAGGFNFAPKPGASDLHPVTRSVRDELMQHLQDGSLDTNALDELRRKLVNAAGEDSGMAAKIRGGMETAINKPDIIIGSPQALDLRDRFLKEWKQKSRYEDIAGIADKSGGESNKIRSNVQRYLRDGDVGDLTPEEQQALLRAGTLNIGDKVARAIGGFGFDAQSSVRNPRTLMPAMALASGGFTGPIGPVAAIAGTIGNLLENRAVNGRLAKVLELIKSRDTSVVPRPTPPPAPPFALPPPGYRAPMSPSQINAAQTQMNAPRAPSGTGGGQPFMNSSKTGVSGVPHDYGDTPYNYLGGQGAAAPKLLPSPEAIPPIQLPEIWVNSAGEAGQPGAAESAAAVAERLRMQQLGLTPDILRVQAQNKGMSDIGQTIADFLKGSQR